MKKYIPVLFGLIPLPVSALGAVLFSISLFSIPLMALSVLFLFVLVRVLPWCRKRENLFIFIYSVGVVTPINIVIIRSLNWTDFLDNGFQIVLWSLLSFFMLFAVEEIVLGIITRFIWKKQYKLPEFDEE